MGSVTEPTNGHTNNHTHQSLDWTVYNNVIDGKLTSTQKTRHGINPATGKPNPEVPVATQDDVEQAMVAAKKASTSWAKVPYAERSKAVLALADALEVEHQAFSDMLVREQGKPVRSQMPSLCCSESVMLYQILMSTDGLCQDGDGSVHSVVPRNS